MSNGEFKVSNVLIEWVSLILAFFYCRLWVVPREPDDPPEAQQIGYVNIVPARNEIGTFDSFGDTVRKFNLHLRQRPLSGNSFVSFLQVR